MGAGSSRYGPDTAVSVRQHVESVRRVLDLLALLALEGVAVVGHDSGGLCLVPGLMEAIKPGESAHGGTKEAPRGVA